MQLKRTDTFVWRHFKIIVKQLIFYRNILAYPHAKHIQLSDIKKEPAKIGIVKKLDFNRQFRETTKVLQNFSEI